MAEDFPLTPRMQHTLERAARISEDNGQTFVGTEHVLLALLDDPAGVAGIVFDRVGVTEALRAEVTRIMASDGYQGRP
jgi:ATP-dependent Clp protease ATP-binding subunit ClpA